MDTTINFIATVLCRVCGRLKTGDATTLVCKDCSNPK